MSSKHPQAKQAAPKPAISLSQPGLLQRSCECGGVPGLTGECEECSKKRLSGQRGTNPPGLPDGSPDEGGRSHLGGYRFGEMAIEAGERLGVQAKLAIGQPGDKYEQEADRVAEQVMRMPDPNPLARVSLVNSNLPFAAHPLPVQKQEVKEEDEEKKKGKIQAKGESGQTPRVTAELEQQLQVSQGRGQPLPEETRSFMESRFGQDFSQVRVHAGSKAAQMNRALNAQAFTHRQDVYFGAGKYSPESSEGKRLLAHELTHVIQQHASTGSAIQRQPEPPSKGELSNKGKILSLEEIAKDPQREKLRKEQGQVEAKICTSMNFTGCRTTLQPGTEVTILERKFGGRWLRIGSAGIPGFGPKETCYVLGTFVKEIPKQTSAPTSAEEGTKEKVIQAPSAETQKEHEKNQTSIEGMLTKDTSGSVTNKSTSQFTLIVNNPPPGKYYYFRWSVRDASNNAYRMLSVEDNTEVWTYGHSKHTYINTPSLQVMLDKNAGLGCQVLCRVLETGSPEIPSFYHPITEINSRVFSIKFDFLPPPNQEKLATLFEHLKQEKWDVDDLAAKLTDSEMISLESSKRISLISYIAEGYSVDDEDETTIIRLIATTPSQDTKNLFGSLNADNAKLYKRLEKVIDGEEYRKYHQVLSQKFSETMKPEEALRKVEEVETANKILPWADPGIIRAMWNHRFYYEEAYINDKGKIHLKGWSCTPPAKTILPVCIPFNFTEDLAPNELIGVHFYFQEEEVGAPKGKTIYMPAINFLSLYNKQFRQELKLIGDIALLGLGGAGIVGASTKLGKLIAALEFAFGAADLSINEFRSEIAETESGKNFLKVWDKVSFVVGAYGMARVALKLPSLFKGLKDAFVEFKGSKPNLKPGDLQKVENSVDDVLKKANAALDESKQTAKAQPEATGTTSGEKPGSPTSETPLSSEEALKAEREKLLETFRKRQQKLQELEKSTKSLKAPRSWDNFNPEHHAEFRAKLREFRGNDDLNPTENMSGREGQIFTSDKKPFLTLKRWFKKQVGVMKESVRKLKVAGDAIEGNPKLKSDVEVVKIHEQGSDWIIRDFEPVAPPLRNLLSDANASAARTRVIAELQRTADPILTGKDINLLNKLIRNSENIRWSPRKQKILIIDLQ